MALVVPATSKALRLVVVKVGLTTPLVAGTNPSTDTKMAIARRRRVMVMILYVVDGEFVTFIRSRQTTRLSLSMARSRGGI